LRKGRKGSRSGSRQSSRERSHDDIGSEEGRTSSRTGSVDNEGAFSDAGSENSLVMRLKKLRRKKPKVQPADFDELFARGLALSAQLESENNQDPFKTNEEGESEYKKLQAEDGIGYAEKVNAFLDDQASTVQQSIDMEPSQKERGRKRHKKRESSNRRKSAEGSQDATVKIPPWPMKSLDHNQMRRES